MIRDTRTPTALIGVALALAALAALACTLTGGQAQPPPDGPPTSAPDSSTPAPAPSSLFDEKPVIWFAPLPPMEIREGRPFIGSDDFMELFTADAPWSSAASRVQVFKLYGEWVSEDATDEELRTAIADLERRGIALAVEAGPLTPFQCGQGIEGFAGIPEGLHIAQRIQEAGGTLQVVAFDEPFAFAHIYDGPNACHWTPEKIAGDLVTYMEKLRTIYPEVVFGDIEPLWEDTDLDLYKTWIETYEAVTGAPLEFFILDVQFTRANWAQDAKELEDFARAHGVEFGMIYFGDWEDGSDEEWLGKAEQRMVLYESLYGGRPEHVFFQSWHDHPDRVLPESTPYTFTHFVNSYARTRTTLTVQAGRSGDGASLLVNGTLREEGGAALAGQLIEYVVTPLAGEGVIWEYRLSGEVPEGATVANVGLRVNTECGCSGPSEIILYEVRYREGEESGNRVPNPGFAAGLDYWGLWGDGDARLEPSDRGAGRMLQVTALPTQSTGVNSGEIAASAGARFEVTFTARVAPEAVGSGYFALIFLGPGGEVMRQTIPFEAGDFAAGSTQTGADGAFAFTLDGPPGGPLAVEVSFAGDARVWPALARATAAGE